MLRKLLTEDDEELDENTYIYNAEFFYEPQEEVDQISLSDQEEEDVTNPLYDSDPIYDTDGEEEFIDGIEEEVAENESLVSEEINFVVGDEIIQVMAERKIFVGEEINFVDGDKMAEEGVVVVNQQNLFQELTISKAKDYKCNKFSGSYIFYNYDLFPKDLKEIRSRSFVDQEGLFVSYLHIRFKVWERFTLWRPVDDYLFLPFESHNKYVNNVMKECGGGLYLIDSDFNYYILHFKGLDNRRKCGEKLDLVDHDLTNDVCVLFLNIEQKQKNELHIAFGDRMIKEHHLISYGNNYNPWGFGEYQGLLLIKKRLDVLFSAIGDGDFSCMVQKQQDKLFLDDGRILHPPNDGIRENSKEVRVAELGDQKKGLNSASGLKIMSVCVGVVKGLVETSKECVLAAPNVENQLCKVTSQIKTHIRCLYYPQTLDDKTGGELDFLWCCSKEGLMLVNNVNKIAIGGSWEPKILGCLNCVMTCLNMHGAVVEDYHLVNGYIEVERDNCYEVGSDFEGRDVIIIVAGCKHQIRDFKVAWNLFSTKEMVVASVNMGENSSLAVDDDLAKLRTIPFEEGGDDTCTDKVQGWFWMNGSWDVWVVLFCTLLAIICYTTKDYLNLFNTYYLLQVICKVDTHYMLVYGCMMHDCMVARYMGRFGCKMTWKDYMAIDVSKMITKVTCLDDKAGVG